MKVLIYRSQGTDDLQIACLTVDEAINCFKADAEAILSGDNYTIELWPQEMTDEEVAKLREE